MRQIFVVGLVVSVAASPALGDSYAPFTDFRVTDATGRYYLVVRKGDESAGGPRPRDTGNL